MPGYRVIGVESREVPVSVSKTEGSACAEWPSSGLGTALESEAARCCLPLLAERFPEGDGFRIVRAPQRIVKQLGAVSALKAEGAERHGGRDVCYPQRQKAHHNIPYSWQLGIRETTSLIPKIFDYLCSRRRSRILELQAKRDKLRQDRSINGS